MSFDTFNVVTSVFGQTTHDVSVKRIDEAKTQMH